MTRTWPDLASLSACAPRDTTSILAWASSGLLTAIQIREVSCLSLRNLGELSERTVGDETDNDHWVSDEVEVVGLVVEEEQAEQEGEEVCSGYVSFLVWYKYESAEDIPEVIRDKL